MSIFELYKEFPTEQSCLDKVFKDKYGNNPICPVCKRVGKYYPIKGRKSYVCYCGHQIAPLAGTVYSKSSTPLRTWFYLEYLLRNRDIPALRIEQLIGCSYKTAWRLRKAIRNANTTTLSNLS